jgi:SAM-dependent methyltransferase
MKNKVIDSFNNLATVYETTVDKNSLYNCEYERPTMMKNLPPNLRGKRVLDAGCAAGWYTQQLLNIGAEVVAVDISQEMVSSANRRIGNNAEILCLDLENELPFVDNFFDFILSSLTLHYLKDWNMTFREFQRILKPNGTFLFSVHHPISDLKLLNDPRYFETELIIDQWKKDAKVYEVPFYRRPLQEILNHTLKYFSIDKVIEPEPTATFKTQSPEVYEKLMRSPQFLIIKAIAK